MSIPKWLQAMAVFAILAGAAIAFLHDLKAGTGTARFIYNEF